MDASILDTGYGRLEVNETVSGAFDGVNQKQTLGLDVTQGAPRPVENDLRMQRSPIMRDRGTAIAGLHGTLY